MLDDDTNKLIAAIFVACVVLVPLGIWKGVEIVAWVASKLFR